MADGHFTLKQGRLSYTNLLASSDDSDTLYPMTTKKIRVCFVCPKAYPIFNPEIESVFGGAEVDLYLIATELAKDDAFEVSFVVADYGQPDEETRDHVRILKSLDFRQNSLIGAWKIWNAMKQTNADWYMLETASPGVPLAAAFCRKPRAIPSAIA